MSFDDVARQLSGVTLRVNLAGLDRIVDELHVQEVRIRSAATPPAPTLVAAWHSLSSRRRLARWLSRYPNGAVWSWAVWERVVPAVRRRA